MKKNFLVIGVVIIVVLLVYGLFVELSGHDKPAPVVADFMVNKITANYLYEGDTHFLKGSILLPECYLLEANYLSLETLPEQITLAFSYEMTADTSSCDDSGALEQAFDLKIPGSPKANFSAVFMGEAVELDLVPVSDQLEL